MSDQYSVAQKGLFYLSLCLLLIASIAFLIRIQPGVELSTPTPLDHIDPIFLLLCWVVLCILALYLRGKGMTKRQFQWFFLFLGFFSFMNFIWMIESMKDPLNLIYPFQWETYFALLFSGFYLLAKIRRAQGWIDQMFIRMSQPRTYFFLNFFLLSFVILFMLLGMRSSAEQVAILAYYSFLVGVLLQLFLLLRKKENL